MRTASLLLATLLVACTGKDRPTGPPPETRVVGADPDEEIEMDTDTEGLTGLKLRLSEAERPMDAGSDRPPTARVDPLPRAQVDRLIARLPEIEAAERTAFKLRAGSPPPPLPGEDVQQPWPPPPRPDVAPDLDPGALSVLRFAPEGEVPMAPHVSVTFSQPMIAVTSQDQASQTVPVQLDPQPPGAWRWLGTKTVLFDPDPRLPMATRYTATIPAGTESALGVALDEAVQFTFETPPPQVRTVLPTGRGNDVDTLVVLAFDQRIDERMIEAVSLRGGGEVTLRQATAADLDEHPDLRAVTERLEEGRWLALVPEPGLEPGTSYTVVVDEGAPSAEGPLTTTRAQTQGFRTYDPLSVQRWNCWEQDGLCNPDGGLSVRLNNALDETTAKDFIAIGPEIPGLVVNVSGRGISFSGDLPARTKVKVTLKAGLTDVFGQRLGKDTSHVFDMGAASEILAGPGKDQVVLDPAGPAAFPIYSRNHDKLDVEVFAMGPGDFGKVSEWFRNRRYDGTNDAPPLTRVRQARIEVPDYAPDAMVETPLDLSEHLDGGLGHVLVHVEPTTQPRERWRRTEVWAWVQRTRVGLTTFVDRDEVLAWATDLQTGAPLEGVEISLLGAPQGTATTDADGLARLGPYGTNEGPHALMARKGDDAAVLPESPGWWNRYGSWTRSEAPTTTRWMTFDDRGLYKPGETVRVKGWMRRFTPTPGEGLKPWTGETPTLAWRAVDSRGAEIATGETRASALGGFDVSFDLPESPNLGTARLELSVVAGSERQSTTHAFQIQEFRRPEYEVTTTVDPRPYVLGQHALATANAAYYSGEPLPGASVSWVVRATAATHRPPGHDDFRFGPWSPWWWGRPDTGGTTVESLGGKTSSDGTHTLRMDFLAAGEPRPYSVRAEATVVDVNRQRWASSSTLLVHPSDRYVGLRAERAFIGKDEPIEVDLIVTGIDGEIVPDVPIEVEIARMVWKKVDGTWQQVAEDAQPCAVTSGEEPVSCTVDPEISGQYRVRAHVRDDKGRLNRTDVTIYVGSAESRPNRSVELEEVLLVPEAETFAVGGTARILVQAPFAPAEGLVTLRQEGLLETRRITLTEPSMTLELEVDERWTPNVHLEVDLVGSAPRVDDAGEPLPDADRRVAYASGSLDLKVPPVTRTLDVALAPAADELPPGASTHVDLTLTDASGAPVADAEVALWIVDEAVLALSGYATPDPIEVFYAHRGAGVREAHLRSRVVLADPQTVDRTPQGGPVGGDRLDDGAMMLESAGRGAARARSKSASGLAGAPPPAPMAAEPMMDMAMEEEAAAAPGGAAASDAPIAVRSDFRALAHFAPRVVTGADGTARVPVELPDSLTRYRVMAVAVDDGVRFGHADTTITARKPLMLRPSPPRFLNVGDRAELPLVVQNPTDRDLTVDLALRVDNAKVLDDVRVDVLTAPERDRAGVRFVVPAEDRREVRIPVGVIDAGTLRFQAVVASRDATDAATDELPVWTPATTEAFATYGSIDRGGIVQPIDAPDDAWTQYGGLEVTTSSTQLQALTDALLYLNQYPFECTEQIASRVLANAALRDVLDAFEAEQLPPAEVLAASVQDDLERLQRRQDRSGGFRLWGASRVFPWASLHATHAIVRAEDKGWDADDRMRQSALRYAATIERHIPSWYSERAKQSIRAYALYVRHRAGDDDLGKARGLYREAGTDLPLEAQAWILPVLHAGGAASEVDAILRHLGNKAVETAAAATFSEAYTDTNDYVLLHSSRRTDGVILESLLEVDDDNDLIVKVVRGLLGHRSKGRWSTTQENSFILLAMDRYFRVYEGVTPDFVARMWIDEGFVGEHAFQGRTTERSHLDVPMAWLTDGDDEKRLTLAMEGEGRLYYRIGLRYAPRDLQLDPADHGFAVERTYEAIDDPDDVRRDDDGTWRIKAGARVRSRVTMVAPSRRTMVALVDPLPGGFEPMNPSLATTGDIPADPQAARTSRYWWWSRPWYSHQNLRDERAEAFAELLWAGVHEYSYVATATTPGRFVVPPPKAEEMYHPETFGRGASARVVIE